MKVTRRALRKENDSLRLDLAVTEDWLSQANNELGALRDWKRQVLTPTPVLDQPEAIEFEQDLRTLLPQLERVTHEAQRRDARRIATTRLDRALIRRLAERARAEEQGLDDDDLIATLRGDL